MAASDRGATSAWDLTYFSGNSGQNEQKYFWDKQEGANPNWCTQKLEKLYAQTH